MGLRAEGRVMAVVSRLSTVPFDARPTTCHACKNANLRRFVAVDGSEAWRCPNRRCGYQVLCHWSDSSARQAA